jgi:arabinan endo-1,5-alpha-L-arabinosidase
VRRLALLLVLLGLVVPLGLVGPVGLVPAGPAAAANAQPGVQLADPDTVRMPDGHYATFGTLDNSGRADTCSHKISYPHVAYIVSTTTSTPNGECITGDALPEGAGSWATANSAIWAPGVVKGPKNWLMFYAARNKHLPQEMCIGVATSTTATGPYRNGREVLCRPGDYWSIDPNPVVFQGKVYLVFRDDYAAPNRQGAISIVRTTPSGVPVAGTRHTLLTNAAVTWESVAAGGEHVIENPTLFRAAGGDWMLMFSGNKWATKNYATGIADCGADLLPLPGPRSKRTVPRCTVAHPDRPYFGYSGAAVAPIHTLPFDHPGPGGMDVYDSPQGPRVVWHWWRKVPTDTTGGYVSERYVAWGLLKQQKNGFVVKFGLS